MAEAALGATIQVVLQTVLSLANDRIGLLFGFKKEFESLRESATMIQAVLADAEARQGQDQTVKLWLKRLEGVAFEADDVFDELNYEILRRQVKSQANNNNNSGKVCLFFSFSFTKLFRWRMASKIMDINTKLKKINQGATAFGLSNRLAALPVPATAGATTSRQTDSVVVPNVVGRANDESKIVEMVLSPSVKVVSVIPIYGPPGLGKTTLAKSIYNNPNISGHFGQKIWVCVAEKIKIEELFKFILESLRREKVEVDRRDTIVQKIREELGEKRYFLVLDDVWNDEQGLWDDFFSTLEGINTTKGSWCLATTRLEQVANTMSRRLKMSVDLYKLGKLSDDECWSILKGKLVAGEQVPNELEAIKMKILRRCDGIPLSANLIGGLLLDKGKEMRRFIVEEESQLNVDQNDVKQIIKMSFDHLRSTSVKNCFAYCSLFPQDTELDKDLLIELWMAEGFLQPDSKNERLMEDTGDNYIRSLLDSSLLLEEENIWGWGRTCYKMHDLVHDFAKSALNEDRYLALTSSQGTAEDIIKKNSTPLRTLFLESSISVGNLSKFECLHVVKLFGKDVKALPDSIGKLIHLRFLDISDSQITKLPKALCKLYNLQTMRIDDGKLEGLPKQMSNLISLRHLHYYDSLADFQMPSEMGRLTHLQTLKFFSVGQEDGRGIEELGNLKDLKGSLEIRNLELVNGKEGAEKAKLLEKLNLSKLKYLWGSGDRESNNCDGNILEGLQPPQNLQELEIRNFVGDRFPEWFISLSKLVKLELTDCKRCRELPALGQLPSLEKLKLNGLENIRSIGLLFYGISSGGGGQVRKFFPALKSLSLADMVNLVEWKDEDEMKSTTGAAEVDLFPVLEDLSIENCSRLTSAPSHFPSIENLKIRFSCHVSLLKMIVNNITSLSSLVLTGNMPDGDDSHRDELIGPLSLVKRRHSNNLEEDVGRDLFIHGCGSLHIKMLVEHLYHLPSFRYLTLLDFSNLTRLAGQKSFFRSIEELTICDCGELTSLVGKMLESCVSLQKLQISGCFRLTSLPGEMLKSCASLKKLVIYNCRRLTNLPGEMLKSCVSLQELEISHCYRLTGLPGEMLESCVSLQELEISHCYWFTTVTDW